MMMDLTFITVFNFCGKSTKKAIALLFLSENFVSLHTMFECYRKHQKIYIILIMSIFVICIFADEYEDMRQFGHKNNPAACMSIAEDDIDFDEDEEDEYLPNICPNRSTILRSEESTITVQKTLKRNQSKALRIGQVRRHFPRGNRIDSHHYTVFHSGSSGVGFPIPLFLCEKKSIQKQ